MKLKAFSVYDKAAAAWMQPFFMKTKGEALRAFMDTVANREHPFFRHAEDYALFQVGEFDDETSSMEKCEPELMARAHELIAKQENE